MMLLYRCFDGGFFVFHSALILFIVFGWIWRRTRRVNLIVNLFTAFSWIVLGYRYGIGYCPCTEWHWQVRRQLGYIDLPRSYIKFLLQKVTGGDAPETWVDVVTAGVFAVVFLLSILLTLRDRRSTRSEKLPQE